MFVQTLTTLLMVQFIATLPNPDSTVSKTTGYHSNILTGDSIQPETESTHPCPNNPLCSCSKNTKLNQQKVNCSNKNMTKIPENFPANTTILILAKNHLTELPDEVFKQYPDMTFLDLSFNDITELKSQTFVGLENLEVLNLHMNKLRYTDKAVPNDTFVPLEQLKTLFLYQNLNDFWDNESYPIQALKHLTNLTHLSMDGMENVEFQSEFMALALESIKLSGRCRGKIGNITRNKFVNLPKLKVLGLKNCTIDFVENGSFVELPDLENLDLSFNENLEFKSMSNITYGLQFTKLAELNLNKIHTELGVCTKLTVENVKYLFNTSVKYLFLDNNRLETMDMEAVDFIPASLQTISVRYNRLALGKFMIRLAYYITNGNRLDNLTTLLLSSQRLPDKITDIFKGKHFMENFYPQNKNRKSKRALDELNELKLVNADKTEKIDIFEESSSSPSSSYNSKASSSQFKKELVQAIQTYQKYLKENCGHCPKNSYKIPIPPNLEYLDLHEMRIRIELQQFCICKNNVETLRCDKNVIWNWEGKLLGFNRLKNLTFANNACSRIAPDFFDNMTSLVTLNISKNFLGTPISKDFEGQIFKKLSNLQSLTISYNRIRMMPHNFFRGLTELRRLILHGNQITDVDWNIGHMENLLYVDLEDNYIVTISEVVRKHWDSLARKERFSVNLAKNKFECTCKHLDLIKWFSQTRVNFAKYKAYNCKFDNGSFGNLTRVSEIYHSLQIECASYTTIILVSSFAFLTIIFTVTAGIVYRYRWNLRYIYYSAKFRLKGYSPVNNYEGDFEHDVFVSYASEDGMFIRQSLVPELENNRGLKLLIHDRDFVAGNFVCDNIMRAITTSYKILIVMSPHFLQSKWCCYEMNMARMEAIKMDRELICVLMKEQVPTSGLPLEVLKIIQQQTYMDYPNENPQHMQQFWDRVAHTLRQQ